MRLSLWSEVQFVSQITEHEDTTVCAPLVRLIVILRGILRGVALVFRHVVRCLCDSVLSLQCLGVSCVSLRFDMVLEGATLYLGLALGDTLGKWNCEFGLPQRLPCHNSACTALYIEQHGA